MRRVLLLLLLLPLFCGRAYAEGLTADAARIFDAAQMESGLSGDEREIGGSLGGEGYDVGAALARLWRAFVGKLKERTRAELGFAARLTALTFLCAFACSLCEGEKARAMIELCGVSAAAALLVGGMDSLVAQTTGAVYRLSDYSKAALPAVYAAAAAGGGVNAAAVGYAGACLALDVMMSLSQKAVLPLIYANLSLTLADVTFPNPMLAAMGRLTKWAAKTILTWSTLAFTAWLGVSGLISAKADAAALKAARSVISGTLPVVGGILSDASAAVLSAASVVLGCMGAFGLVAVCAMCLGPFALLSVKGMLFKAVAAAAESVHSPRLQRLFAGIGGVVGLLMGLLGANALMLFLSLGAAMKAVA